MTDHEREPGRIDLRSLDEPADSAQADRVIGAALARAKLGGRRMGGWRPDGWTGGDLPIWAAAALLLLAVGLLLARPPRAEPLGDPNLIAQWTATGHVPTNAELLAAFGRYDR